MITFQASFFYDMQSSQRQNQLHSMKKYRYVFLDFLIAHLHSKATILVVNMNEKDIFPKEIVSSLEKRKLSVLGKKRLH